MYKAAGVIKSFTSSRSLSRAFWSGADAAATPFSSLLTTALLVRSLGRESYGVLVIVLAVSALSMSINPAIAAATTRFVAGSASSGHQSPYFLSRMMGASVAMVATIALVLLLCTVLAVVPLSHLIFGQHLVLSTYSIHTALILAVLAICLQQFDAIFAAALKGLERFREQAIMEVMVRLSIAGAMVVTGLITHNLIKVLWVNCAGLTVAALCRAMCYRSLTPSAIFLAFPSKSEFRAFLSFGAWMWLSATATAAYGTVDRLIVGRVLGPADVAEFQIYLQLAALVHFIPSSVFAFSFPAFSRMSEHGGQGAAYIHSAYRKLALAIIVTASTITAFLALLHSHLWILLSGSRAGTENPLIFFLLLSGFLILALNVAPYYLLLGLGRSRNVSLITSVSVAGSIVAALILIPKFALIGAACARFVYGIGTSALIAVARRELLSRRN